MTKTNEKDYVISMLGGFTGDITSAYIHARDAEILECLHLFIYDLPHPYKEK